MAARFSRPGWRPDLYAASMDAAGQILGAIGSNPSLTYLSKTDLMLHDGDSRWAFDFQHRAAGCIDGTLQYRERQFVGDDRSSRRALVQSELRCEVRRALAFDADFDRMAGEEPELE